MKKILYVICPNGFGHVKRSLAISEALLDRLPYLSLTFFVHPTSGQYLDEYASMQLQSSSNQIITDPRHGFSLQHLALPNFTANYNEWRSELSAVIKATSYDLVLSDNLASPLEFFDRTILTGSFLWHAILDRNSQNDTVLDHEAALVAKYKPVMINIEGMGMPSQVSTTKAVPIPWITSRYATIQKKSPRILVTAGKSGTNREMFKQVASTLALNSRWEIFANQDIQRELGLETISTFDFTEDSFSKLSLIIARPGIGILTDAIKYSAPILTHETFDNKELHFNATRVQELKIGEKIDLLNKKTLLETVANMIGESNSRRFFLEGLSQQKVGGATIAANAIIEYL